MFDDIIKINLSKEQYKVFLKYGEEALTDGGGAKILKTIKTIGGGVIMFLKVFNQEDANALRHSRFILD